MYCAYCGKSVDEGASFCAQCGKPTARRTDFRQTPERFSQGAYPTEPRPDPWTVQRGFSQTATQMGGVGSVEITDGHSPNRKKAIIISVAAILMLIVTAVTAALVLSSGKPKNDLAVLCDAVESVSTASAADISIEIYDDGNSGTAKISWIFGKDIYSSAIEIITSDYYGISRMIICNGEMISGSIYEGDDINDPYNYYYDGNLVEMGYGDIIKDNQISTDSAFGSIDDTLDDVSAYGGLDAAQVDAEDITKVFTDFIYEKCEEDGLTDKFFNNIEKTNNSGITEYRYTLNIRDFLNVFEDYIEDISKDAKYIEKNELSMDALETLETVLNLASQMLKYIGDEFPKTFDVALSVDGEALKSLDISFLVEGDKYGIKLVVDNLNSSDIDLDALSKLVNEVK